MNTYKQEQSVGNVGVATTSAAINNNKDNMVPVLMVRDLAKVYASGKKTSVYALRGVSLAVYPGEFVAIMGTSGSGKSTFMNLIGCLDVPTRGEYWLNGKRIDSYTTSQLAEIRNRFIGFIFQSFNLLGRADALHNVCLPMLYAGLPSREQRSRAARLLQLVGLKKYIHHRPSQLSGGQQQRVATARALANYPTLLLADEPTGALDSITSMEIMAVLQELNEQGLTIILVTHDQKIAKYVKRQVTFLDGQIIRDEPVLAPLSAREEWEALKKREADANKALREEALSSEPEAQTSSSVSSLTTASKHSTLLSEQPDALLNRVSLLQHMPREARLPRRRGGSLTMLGANFQSAIVALWANRSRSLLTTLGIFIGIAAVIAALIFSQGASAKINAIGSNAEKTISIFPIATNNAGGAQGSTSQSSLTLKDIRALELLPNVDDISPTININTQVVYGDQEWDTQVQGVNENYQMIADWHMAKGSWFDANDNTQGATTAVLGDTVAHNLFDASGDAPIGKTIRVRDQLFHIVGVLSPKGGALGGNLDDVVYVPFNTALTRLRNTGTVDQIQVIADNAQDVDALQQPITQLLEQNHHILKGGNDDFYVTIPTQALQQSQIFASVMTALLLGIATISLTVGGIGVMDIMIVSVTERTREIGIRIALGARRYDILVQFLIEALILCLVGGLLGLLLGLLLGQLMTSSNDFPFIISFITLFLPFIVTTVIALIFGLYPAVRASRLDPIRALRTAV